MRTIVEINEEGMINTRDINFNAIGSGSTQAINTLLFQKHSKSDGLLTTIYNVYKAKKNSEVAVGVGWETDLFVLQSDGSLLEITDENILKLENIYKQEMEYGKNHKELKNIANDLKEVEINA